MVNLFGSLLASITWVFKWRKHKSFKQFAPLEYHCDPAIPFSMFSDLLCKQLQFGHRSTTLFFMLPLPWKRHEMTFFRRRQSPVMNQLSLQCGSQNIRDVPIVEHFFGWNRYIHFRLTTLICKNNPCFKESTVFSYISVKSQYQCRALEIAWIFLKILNLDRIFQIWGQVTKINTAVFSEIDGAFQTEIYQEVNEVEHKSLSGLEL